MEIEIQELKNSIDKIINVNKDQMIRLDEISGNLFKQEIILARIENVEDKFSEEISNVHKRIDVEIAKCKDTYESMNHRDELKDIINIVILVLLIGLIILNVMYNNSTLIGGN